MALPASAAVINLSHNNSTVSILDTNAYMTDWTVDGVDHLSEQLFFFRIGPAGGESEVATLNLSSSTTYLGTRGLELVFADPGGDFTLSLNYLLTGGPGAQEIAITNTSGSSLDFHFFQWADFDLNNTATDDSVEVPNANTVRQTEGLRAIEETVATPAPSYFEVAFATALLTALTDGSPTTLANVGGPLGPGDVEWAFQWDVVLDVDDQLLISKNLRLEISPIPVPAAVWLFGSALGLLGWIRRRQNAA